MLFSFLKQPCFSCPESDADEIDPQSSSSVKKAFIREDCRRFLAGYSYHRPVFPRDSLDEEEVPLTQLICSINKTLSFVAVDTVHYFHFAESLGVDVIGARDKTAVVIVDPTVSSTIKRINRPLVMLNFAGREPVCVGSRVQQEFTSAFRKRLHARFTPAHDALQLAETYARIGLP